MKQRKKKEICKRAYELTLRDYNLAIDLLRKYHLESFYKKYFYDLYNRKIVIRIVQTKDKKIHRFSYSHFYKFMITHRKDII